jgi:hypothetical protein
MDTNPADPQWARISNSAAFNLRGSIAVIRGYTRMLKSERLGPLNVQQQKALLELERSASRIDDVLIQTSMLVRYCEGRLGVATPSVLELGSLVRDITSTLTIGDPERSWDIRPGDGDQHVRAVESDLRLLAAAVIQCVWFSLRGTGDLSIWVVASANAGPPERWLAVMPSEHMQRALDPDNLRPFTDDRSSSRFALETALGSRLVTANGGRVLVFREKSAGAVIALPRA